MRTSRSNARGFTLVEVLVGLAVFSIGVMALFHLRGESVRSAVALEERAVAQIVAENRIIEALQMGVPLAIGTREGEVAMADRVWEWREEVAETPNAALWRVQVSVRAQDNGDVLAEINAFREAN